MGLDEDLKLKQDIVSKSLYCDNWIMSNKYKRENK